MTISLNLAASDLKDARRRTALLREQLAERKLKRAVEVQEQNTFWMEPFQELALQWRNRDLTFRGPSSRNDRRWGRDYPVYSNEQELAFLRAPSRLLCATNSYAQGLLEGLSSYVNGTGFTYKAAAKDPVDQPLADACQEVVDEFLERNAWFGGEEPGLEDEQFGRSHEDGESFQCLTVIDEGRTEVRNFEPERITLPPGMDMRTWSFGVMTDPTDAEKPLSYWYQWGDTSDEGMEYTPDEIVHFRRNVRRGMKRGIPSFAFDAYEKLYLASRLATNAGEGAAEREAIAFVRQHATATVEQINDFVGAQADYYEPTGGDPFGLRTVPTTRMKAGRHEDIPKSMEYTHGPAAESGDVDLQIYAALLRAGGVRFNAPEWLGSGDASNNNYASSLTGESPFVRYVLRDQRPLKSCRKKAVLYALQAFCEFNGGLPVGGVTVPWEEVKARIDLQVEAPSPEVRDKDTEASRLETENRNRVTSRHTWQQLVGRDPDAEDRNFEEEDAEDLERAATQMAAGVGPDGLTPMPPDDDDENKDVPESLLESIGDLLEMAGNQFDAAKHPRDRNGKFISVGELSAAQHDPTKAEALRQRVRPEDRQKLERRLKPGGKTGERKRAAREFLKSLAKSHAEPAAHDEIMRRPEVTAAAQALLTAMAKTAPDLEYKPDIPGPTPGESREIKARLAQPDAPPLPDPAPPASTTPSAPPVAELHPKIPVYVRGNTFAHKDELKKVGTWDADRRAWRISQEAAKRFKSLNLPGLTYTVDRSDVEFYHPERFKGQVTESLEEGAGEMLLESALLEVVDASGHSHDDLGKFSATSGKGAGEALHPVAAKVKALYDTAAKNENIRDAVAAIEPELSALSGRDLTEVLAAMGFSRKFPNKAAAIKAIVHRIIDRRGAFVRVQESLEWKIVDSPAPVNPKTAAAYAELVESQGSEVARAIVIAGLRVNPPPIDIADDLRRLIGGEP